MFFIFVLVWSFMASSRGWERLLLDGDTGIHIRIGDYIRATHTVPSRDLFSFSKPGEEWFAFEWLSEVVFSFLNASWGLKGVVLFSAIVLTATYTILLRFLLERGVNLFVGLLLSLMAINATAIHFHARPHIFTLLLLAIGTWILARDREKPRRATWWLAPLVVLWTNLHGGFALFLVLLGFMVIGTFLEGRRADSLRYALVTAACGAASLVNPYGIQLHLHIFDILKSKWIVNFVDEFRSPQFRSEPLLHYMVLLFLGLAMLAPLLSKRKFVEALWILFLAYSSLVSVRHIPIYVMVAIPIIAVELSALWTGWAAARSKKSIARILDDLATQTAPRFRWTSAWIPGMIAILALNTSIEWPKDFSEELFPTKFIRKHSERLATTRLFTPDQWAGYLIFHHYPRQRVFLDGRHNYYGEQIGNDYMRLGGGHHTWREVIERYRFDTMLIEVSSPLASLMKTHAAWRVADDDGKTLLIERR
ncbi:MAG: hypothetical protein ACRD8O_07595 [Bryobacteraceae bacterium]